MCWDAAAAVAVVVDEVEDESNLATNLLVTAAP
jgi:hypothetical protein